MSAVSHILNVFHKTIKALDDDGKPTRHTANAWSLWRHGDLVEIEVHITSMAERPATEEALRDGAG